MTFDSEEGRPGGSGLPDDTASGQVPTSVRHPYVVAVELLAAVPERERAIFEAAWSAGYGVGFQAGTEVGHRRAHAEIAVDWAAAAAQVRATARHPTFAELEQRRWGGRREDIGDHPGGPVSVAGWEAWAARKRGEQATRGRGAA